MFTLGKLVFLAEKCVSVVCVKTFFTSFHDFTEAEIGMEPRKESSLSLFALLDAAILEGDVRVS